MTLPCIVCRTKLESVVPEFDNNQPYKGTTFMSHGQYGSTVWDPMDGSFIQINICDECLTAAATDRMVLVCDEYWTTKVWVR